MVGQGALGSDYEAIGNALMCSIHSEIEILTTFASLCCSCSWFFESRLSQYKKDRDPLIFKSVLTRAAAASAASLARLSAAVGQAIVRDTNGVTTTNVQRHGGCGRGSSSLLNFAESDRKQAGRQWLGPNFQVLEGSRLSCYLENG